MNSVEIANALIDRAKNLQEFEIYCKLYDNTVRFDGIVPFDITIKNDTAIFKVLALSKEEAKQKVDEWLKDRT